MDLVTLTQSSFGEAESNSSVEMPLDPLVVGSFNLQVQVYVKHPAIWHRNDRPSQLKHPRVSRRETLSHLLCTPEEDALLFEVTNACGDITVDATRAVPIFDPQLHLHCGLQGVGHHRIGDLNVEAGAEELMVRVTGPLSTSSAYLES